MFRTAKRVGIASWKVLASLAVLIYLNAPTYAAGKPKPPPVPTIDPAIVYMTYGGSSGIGNLAIANADGTNQKIILSNSVWNRAPSWSPEGTKIVFFSDVAGPGIYVLSINRSTGEADGTPQKIAPIISSYLGMAKPVWSPVPLPVSSGSNRYFVAYSDTTSPNGSDYSIHLVDPSAPGSQFKLSSSLVSTTFGDVGMTWSPDATRLAVSRGRDDSQVPPYDIQIVTLQATDCPLGALVCEVQPRQSLVRDIAGSPLMTADDLLNPTWGNSGAEIAVGAFIRPNANSDIWAIPVLYPEGASNLTKTNKVSPPDRHETLPTWSPDDSQIAYRALGNLCNSKDRNFQGIVVRNVSGKLIDGCIEKILIKDGNFPSWWRNHVP